MPFSYVEQILCATDALAPFQRPAVKAPFIDLVFPFVGAEAKRLSSGSTLKELFNWVKSKASGTFLWKADFIQMSAVAPASPHGQ